MQIKRDILWRIGVIYILVAVFALAIIGRIAFLQYVEGKKWRGMAEEIQQRDIVIPAVRGNICADDGSVLAGSVPIYDIHMDLNPDVVHDSIFSRNIDALCRELSELFYSRDQKSAYQYKRELTRARNQSHRYHLIRRNVSYNELKRMKGFPIFREGRYRGGLIAEQQFERRKPFNLLAERTIGNITESTSGNIVGIEGAYDSYLKGVDGVRYMQRIPGNAWRSMPNENTIEPRDGNDIITSINIVLQDVAEHALLQQLSEQGAHHGCAILMEVETGNVKAIANLTLGEDGKYHETYNYAIGESTEPGSTFKLPVIMTALEAGYVDLDDTIDTKNGVKYYYNQKMEDSHVGGYGKISVQEIIEKSSNIGISTIITKYFSDKPQDFVDRLSDMHLNEKLDIEIKGEGEPFINHPKSNIWSGVSLPWMSHGYEVRMTPLQILCFYNALANDGKMVKPRFVEGIRDHSQLIRKFKPEVIDYSICSKSTLKKVHKMLVGVVERGTAANLRHAPYKIAGKTGTAQIANDGRGYEGDRGVSYQGSFVGYFPANDPKYSCIVVVNAPSRGVYYGNRVAGTVFKEIADKVYGINLDIVEPVGSSENLMAHNIPSSLNGHASDIHEMMDVLKVPVEMDEVHPEWVVSTQKSDKLSLQKRFVNERFVPNVEGMGLKDALYLLENSGLKVKTAGYGRVVKQSVNPGTPAKGQTIYIDLR